MSIVERLKAKWRGLSTVGKVISVVIVFGVLFVIAQTNQNTNQNKSAANAAQQEQSNQEEANKVKAPKTSFEDFVAWYGNNKSAIISQCTNADFTEEQSFACLKEVYKDYLRPELFTKENELNRSNLISNVALMNSTTSASADVNLAKQVYNQFAVVE